MLIKSCCREKIFGVVVCLICIFASQAQSQPPPQPRPNLEGATRETDQNSRETEKIEKGMVRPPEKPPEGKPSEIRPVKEGEKFFVQKVELVGVESFFPEDFDSLIKKYEGKELTFGELDALAKEIGREYLKKGVIAAVFVPPQDVQNQTVILRVVEARMGDLEIQDHKYFKSKRLNFYWKILPGEILHYDKLSRNIQMMNRNTDREARAALRAGKKPGTTDVILTAETNFPMHLSFAFDKEGQVSTGKSRKTLGWRHNNLLGLDDTVLTGYTWGRNYMGLYAYHSVPVTPNGTTLVYGYSYSESKPKKDYAQFGIDSKSENKSVTFRQDLFNKDDYVGEAYLGFDAKDKLTKTNTGLLNRDKLRIFKAGTSFVNKEAGSSTTFSQEYNQGIGAFCANSKEDPMMSRGVTSAVFSKFTWGMRHKSVLPLDIQESVKLEGQYTLAKLVPQEQYSLGGLETVRGYPSSDLLADNALLLNGELLLPSFYVPKDLRLPYAKSSLKDQITTVIFIDYGYGERRSESKSHNLIGVGAGLRISLYDQILIRLEWGLPMGDDPITEESRDPRFHFSVDVQERLPEEIERIKKVIQEENIQKMAWRLVDEELARPGSLLAQRLYEDLYWAQIYHREGKFREAKEIYERIDRISKSLYKQAEGYVRSCVAQQERLKKSKAIALTTYKEGNLEEAREAWKKVIDEARAQSLTLEF